MKCIIKLSKKPPSVNAMYANNRGAGKGRFKTKAYKQWLDLMKWEILQRPDKKRFEGEVKLTFRFGEVRGNADLSNYIKATEDLLVNHGIIRDDKFKIVKELNVQGMPSEGVEIEIEQMPAEVGKD